MFSEKRNKSVNPKKILIMGVGNLLMGDDGVGVHLINRLGEEKLSPNVDLIDGGTAGFGIIDHMDEYDSIFIIDAMDAGLKPGEVSLFSDKEIIDQSLETNHSLHGHGLLTVLKVAESIGKQFNVKLIAIQAVCVEEGTALSRVLSDELPKIINFIKECISNEQKDTYN